MGMFDYVSGLPAEMRRCPTCGKVTDDSWQTKDADCSLSVIPYRQVSNFYTICPCGEWLEWQRREARGRADYKRPRSDA